jgi:chromosome segregation protein
MRLERLEIAGFKSFPERADLAFDSGVTAIVGPNGCGKSNVVDAITWVLGEQSAKSLRGERMEDVIFNGSDARKPTAAAEVRLRLSGVASLAMRRVAERRDPSTGSGSPHGPSELADALATTQFELPATDTRDVEVARRLYRSGESEYLIDGDVVRLRDVQDLLMDAGLGVKGYAVIEQGKIGQILSAKPTERRQLIEEAAGVTKYKSRRRAAELKLEAAQQNLTRVDDIVFELEKQRAALKRQAGRARRYRKLREELRRWEKVLFARRYRALAQSIEVARARLAEAREREATAAAMVTSIEQAADDVRRRLATADADLGTAREASHARQLEIERRQQQMAFDRQQVESLDTSTSEIAADLGLLEARREPVHLELEGRREGARRAEADRDEAAGALAREEETYATAAAGIEAGEGDVERARSRVMSGLSAMTTLNTVIERAVEARERIVAELGRLDAEASDLRVETESLAAERQRAAEALTAAREAADRARQARATEEQDLAVARAGREARWLELRERERELAASGARLASLEQLEAAREGYGEAARAILHDGIAQIAHLGSVADYIETDDLSERAVEACLGELLQAVVVRTTAEAAHGLDVVRQRGLGRCGFLVLDGAPSDPPAHAALDGTVPLVSRLRIAGDVAPQLRAAVGEAYIAESFDVAARAAASTRGPVATPAGDVFRGDHLVLGGGRSEALGILATKRQIKDLRERLAPEVQHAQQLSIDVAALEATVAGIEQAVAATVSHLHVHEKSVLEHEVHVARLTEALDRIARKQGQIASERRRVEEERRSLDARQDEARRSIARLAAEQQESDSLLAAAQHRLVEARDHAAGIGRRVSDARAAHAAPVERASGLANEAARLEEAARELEARIAARIEERLRNGRRRAELEQAIAEAGRQLAHDRHEFEALGERVQAAEAAVAELQSAALATEAEVREARAALDDMRGTVGQLDVARATAEADLAHLAASCVDTLQASLDEVADEVAQLEAAGDVAPDATVIYGDDETDDDLVAARADSDVAVAVEAGAVGLAVAPAPAAVSPGARSLTAEEAIAELRAKIDRLGPVNMMAIEQFDELETRYTFLSAQRKDLVDSIAATGEAIKRIDKTTRERFREAYTAINLYFEEMFTTLFGGGRAGLVMLDEDDQLESGIDIIAQPPGKRLQNVQLLSGGEKALTAMGLLFAMFRYRPSPFCLLDEIDAPLDDANIGRFLEMLKGMLERTQFIVITHSRKTMEMADRLYGVTMEEPGVSKLISLKLN